MLANHDPLKKAFDCIKEVEAPSEQQKEKMLHIVLTQGNQHEISLSDKIWRAISVYPWRVAFGVSTVQAVTFTLIFGTRYTNMLLSFFGG